MLNFGTYLAPFNAMDMNDSLINLLGDQTFSWWMKKHEKE